MKGSLFDDPMIEDDAACNSHVHAVLARQADHLLAMPDRFPRKAGFLRAEQITSLWRMLEKLQRNSGFDQFNAHQGACIGPVRVEIGEV